MGIVYIAENVHTNEKYIGHSTKPLYKRKSDHKYEAFVRKRESLFYKALRAYGWDCFKWNVLYESNNLSHLRTKEQVYIKHYNTVNHGYNTQYR